MKSRQKLKFKILYLTFHPHIGGGESILLALIRNLDKKLFSPYIVIPKRGQLSEKLKKGGVPIYIIPLSGFAIRTFFVPGMSIFSLLRFLKLVKNIKPDIIHLNHLNLVFYAGIASKILKIPVVATAHGPWDSFYFYQDLLTNIFVDKTLANTSRVRSALLKKKILPPSKVRVINFGIETDRFKPGNKLTARKKLSLPADSFIVSIVGRIDPIKDHLTFFKATELVYEKYLNILFYVVGSSLGDFSRSSDGGYRDPIRKYLKAHPALAKKVKFSGFIDDMPTIYQATDILVSSSLSESFGLSLAEAASCQVPIVATNIGGQHLIVKNNQTGFLVPPQNPQALAQKILTLLQNKDLRVKFGQQGRKYIIDNFTIRHYVEKVQEIYLESI